MAVDLNKVSNDAKGWWTQLPKKKQVVLLGSVISVMLAAGVILDLKPGEPYSALFTDMAPEDAAEAIEILKQKGVPYRIARQGRAIEVPDSQVHELRLSLASSGLAGGGTGFELFDKQSFGTTSFVEQTNYRRALEGELARTITAIGAVQRARVHLALKQKSIFQKQVEDPTASIAVKLKPGNQLKAEQISGIVSLVASSVEGLKRENVTLVGQRGEVLWNGEKSPGDVETTAQERVEAQLQSKVAAILDRVVGPGHSAVTVTAEINTEKRERTEELYFPDGRSLRSEAISEEMKIDGEKQGGAAGVRARLSEDVDVNTTSEKERSDDGLRKREATRNYEINRTVSKIVGAQNQIKRLYVAVVVDTRRVQTSSASKESSAEILQQIEKLASEAAGVDSGRGDRISVESIPFAVDENITWSADKAPPPYLKDPKVVAGAAASALVFAGTILGLFFRVRKRNKEIARLKAEKEAAEAAKGASHETGSILSKLTERKLDAAERGVHASFVTELAKEDASRAARILATWLAETNEKERDFN